MIQSDKRNKGVTVTGLSRFSKFWIVTVTSVSRFFRAKRVTVTSLSLTVGKNEKFERMKLESPGRS